FFGASRHCGRSKSSGNDRMTARLPLTGVAPPTSYVGWIARVFAGSSGVFIAWASVLTSERSFSRSGTGRQRRPRTYAKSHFAGAPSRLVLVGQPATITWIGAQLPTSFDQNPFRGIYLGTSGATAVIYEQADP